MSTVPLVPGLSLNPPAVGAGGHDDGHGASGPRADLNQIPSWTSRTVLRNGHMLGRTSVNGTWTLPPMPC